MTCKDCVHYEVCGGFTPTDLDRDVFDYVREGRSDEIPNIEERCSEAKPKSRFVELPCEVGSKIYMLVTRKTYSFEYVFKDGKRNMIKQQNQHTFIKDTYFTKLNFWKVLEDFGKTVFPSRELAEEALKERESK